MNFGANKFKQLLLGLVASLLLATPALGQATGTNFRHYTSATIDGTSTGTTTVYTTLSDIEGCCYRFLEPFAASTTVLASTNVLTPAVISIGTNSPNFDNIVSATTVGSSVLKIRLNALSTDMPAIPADTDIKVKVVTACIPVLFQTATCNFKVSVVGVEQFPAIE